MRFLGWLISWYLPLCGTYGATGIPAPGVVDFSQLHMKTHSRVLVAPAGTAPAPDIVSPVFALPPAALFAALQGIAAREARTYPLDDEPAALQAAWVVRSAGFNFPDVVEIAVLPEPRGSSFIYYGHALYGWSDYGVNANRAKAWLQQLKEITG